MQPLKGASAIFPTAPATFFASRQLSFVARMRVGVVPSPSTGEQERVAAAAPSPGKASIDSVLHARSHRRRVMARTLARPSGSRALGRQRVPLGKGRSRRC